MKKLVGLVVTCAASLVWSVSAAESCEATDLIHRWSFNGSLVDACGGNTARFDGGGVTARKLWLGLKNRFPLIRIRVESRGNHWGFTGESRGVVAG